MRKSKQTGEFTEVQSTSGVIRVMTSDRERATNNKALGNVWKKRLTFSWNTNTGDLWSSNIDSQSKSINKTVRMYERLDFTYASDVEG